MKASSLTTLFYALLTIMILNILYSSFLDFRCIFKKTYFTVDGLFSHLYFLQLRRVVCIWVAYFGDHVVPTTRIFKTGDFKLDHRNLKVLCIIFKRTKTPLIN